MNRCRITSYVHVLIQMFSVKDGEGGRGKGNVQLVEGVVVCVYDIFIYLYIYPYICADAHDMYACMHACV